MTAKQDHRETKHIIDNCTTHDVVSVSMNYLKDTLFHSDVVETLNRCS